MWRFEERSNYAASIFPKSSRNLLKKFDSEGEPREMVTGEYSLMPKGGLVVVFKSWEDLEFG